MDDESRIRKEPLGSPLTVGRVYVYTKDWPRGCKGGLYRLVRLVLNVPTYQQQVLLRCVRGKDRGLWFSCSCANFATRYEPLVQSATKCDPPPEPPSARVVPQVEFPDRVANMTTSGRE